MAFLGYQKLAPGSEMPLQHGQGDVVRFVMSDVHLLEELLPVPRPQFVEPLKELAAYSRGGPHTYINCDPILSFLGACES